MNPRYTKLAVVALLLQVVSILTLIAGPSWSAWLLVRYFSAEASQRFFSVHEAVMGAAAFTAKAVLASLILFAFSELIHVLLDIEVNTRRAADAASGETSDTTPKA
ncbi:MAG: hypothetical protein K1X53_10515 [Candidatus Sumerlaeaceae bacterium]|nr:hypothetical protein [Candidatus Sumerlaeaceae bacterium]